MSTLKEHIGDAEVGQSKYLCSNSSVQDYDGDEEDESNESGWTKYVGSSPVDDDDDECYIMAVAMNPWRLMLQLVF